LILVWECLAVGFVAVRVAPVAVDRREFPGAFAGAIGRISDASD
jgi:hypothetical protein